MKKIVIKHPANVKSKVFDFESSFHIIDGVNSEVNLKVNNDHHQKKYGFRISDSEIETFKRHIQAWKYLIECDDDCALILEENVEFSEIHIDYGDLKRLPDSWHIFLPYNMQEIVLRTVKSQETNLLNHNSREVFDIEPFLTGVEWGSSFYFIRKKGAKILIDQINEIKQRVEDEILYLSKTRLVNLYIRECIWMDISKIHKKDHFDRNMNIHNAVLNYNTWDDKARKKVLDLLGFVSDIASSLGIPLLLQGGTHLGYVRHGGIMGWDDDIDIGIEEGRFAEFANKVERNGYKIISWVEWHSNTTYYKIWHEDGRTIQGYPYKFPFLDLWLYKKEGKDIIFSNGIICPDSGLKPFVEIRFEGCKFFIPYNSLDVLDSRYKDWRSMIRIYSYNHANEKPSNYILSTPVEVDEGGRIIIKSHRIELKGESLRKKK